MQVNKLQDMVKGWFVGNFEPTLYKTGAVEVAVKTYQKGEREAAHYHKIAAELTCVVSGRVRMNGAEYQAGDIITIEPHESTDFEALEDNTVNVVVKIPGAPSDKYFSV
jgi:quercetin dioxygenase-like cupin family protein